MVDDYMLDKVLDKIKEIIGIEKFDGTKILIYTDDKFPDDITLKNVMILMECVIKDDLIKMMVIKDDTIQNNNFVCAFQCV